MKIKACISTLRKLQFNRIKDVDELIEITGMVYEDLIYGVFNGENSSRKTLGYSEFFSQLLIKISTTLDYSLYHSHGLYLLYPGCNPS